MGSHPRGRSRLCREHLPQHSPDDLSSRHPAAVRRSFELQCLPEGKQQGKLNDFLICPGCLG